MIQNQTFMLMWQIFYPLNCLVSPATGLKFLILLPQPHECGIPGLHFHAWLIHFSSVSTLNLLLSIPGPFLGTLAESPSPLPTLESTVLEWASRPSTYPRNTKILWEWVAVGGYPTNDLLTLQVALAASCLARVSLLKKIKYGTS